MTQADREAARKAWRGAYDAYMDWYTPKEEVTPVRMIAEATARAEAAEARNKVLADTLGSVPIPDRQEPARDFYERMNVWLQGPYTAASKALGGEHER